MSNQYTYSPPFTEEELLDSYVNKGMSQCEIATMFKTSQRVVWRALKKAGIPSRKAAKRDQRGPKNASWKGGRFLVAKSTRQRGERAEFGNGYFYVLLPGHPNANKSGYVAEHIAVVTEAIGRPLNKGEIVHHINLNKHDNRIENLALCNRKVHAIWHAELEELAVQFMKEGLITFSPDKGYTRISKASYAGEE